MERAIPTQADVLGYLRDQRNWNRWGPDDQRGALNLITPQKRAAAARQVRTGRSVSLARRFPKWPGPDNPEPAQHFMRWFKRGTGGVAVDYYAISYHGFATTHLDALCHIWDEEGMWGGRRPDEVLSTQGARWGDIEQWHEGIVTRGVLLDVPRFRGEPFVTCERPVHGWELEDIAAAQNVQVEPGDALFVYSGREAWHQTNPPEQSRPGLHASCLPFLRTRDIALLGWDLMDAAPTEYDVPFTVHAALFAYGVALLDNALLEPLAQACAEEGRYEFMFMVAPLRVRGGTGSPVNPIALF